MRTFCIALFALLLWVSSCSGQEVEDDLEESLFEEAFQPSIEQSSSKENAEGRKNEEGKKKPGKKIIAPPPPPSGSDQQQQEGWADYLEVTGWSLKVFFFLFFSPRSKTACG